MLATQKNWKVKKPLVNKTVKFNVTHVSRAIHYPKEPYPQKLDDLFKDLKIGEKM
jgi:hypothetical protein